MSLTFPSVPFDTNIFFSGGAGMFIQYHDIVKPVYLMAVIKMIIGGDNYGLPIKILQQFSIPSLIEWYLNRRYINPLRCLDYNNSVSTESIDQLLQTILHSDDSLYTLAPTMNIHRLLSIYEKQRMIFPIYLYSEQPEPYLLSSYKSIFPGIQVRYLHGNLEEAIAQCDQNFTYILSDVELIPPLVKLLAGTCSHVILATDYRYNINPKTSSCKYNLATLSFNHPFVRLEEMIISTPTELALQLKSTLDNVRENRKELL